MAGKRRSGCSTLILGAVLLFGGVWLVDRWVEYRQGWEQQERELARQEKVRANYKANRDRILIDLRKLADSKEWGRAKRYVDDYSVIRGDAALDSLRERIQAGWALQEEQRLLAKVRKVPAREVEENLRLYQQLRKLNPGKDLYKRKIRHYQEKLNALRAQERAEAERQERLYGKRPTAAKWAVADYLESIAHDPDSIEVQGCTAVMLDKKRGWVTGCTFRGRNAFGALIRQSGWFRLRGNRVVEQLPADAY